MSASRQPPLHCSTDIKHQTFIFCSVERVITIHLRHVFIISIEMSSIISVDAAEQAFHSRIASWLQYDLSDFPLTQIISDDNF